MTAVILLIGLVMLTICFMIIRGNRRWKRVDDEMYRASRAVSEYFLSEWFRCPEDVQDDTGHPQE